MPRVLWPLRHGRPCIEIVLTLALGGQSLVRTLLADTGAASQTAGFELLLEEHDCLRCSNSQIASITLGGAYAGRFQMYDVSVRLPALGFAQDLPVVAVHSTPVGFGGIACFRFLNRFTYGNLGDPQQFGLEC
jgi:hypothetical protein